MINLQDKKLIVIKIGTNVLTDDSNRLDLNNLRNLVGQISYLKKQGKQIILVSSGSIICGSEELKISPKNINDKQAAAAVGQVLLMEKYQGFFVKEGIVVAQILLTKDAFIHLERAKHARNTFRKLLDLDIIPIVNENDTIAVDEIKFSDNDNLSAMASVLVGADAEIILTDIDGLYDNDPKVHPNASICTEINEITDQMVKNVSSSKSSEGVGGMKTKLEAAKYLLEHNIYAIIANGRRDNILIDLYKGTGIGSYFLKKAKP